MRSTTKPPRQRAKRAAASTTTTTTPQKPKRRTQQERTATMRARLLQATVDCLVERGYQGTTTAAVIDKAGVSRGAVLHHFPTKKELVVTAVEFVMEQRNAAFRARFEALQRESIALGDVIDALWHEIYGPTFFAWLELLVAARTDPELHEQVAKIAVRYTDTVDASFRAIFGVPREQGRHPHALAPILTFVLLEGLALERIARPSDAVLEKRVLRAMLQVLPAALAPR